MDSEGNYYGPYGTVHNLIWGISGLWNCNKCATLSVSDISGNSTASKVFNFNELATFSSQEGIATQMYTYTSYEDWNYNLDLYDCDSPTNTTDPNPVGPMPGPYPDCTAECTVDITSVSKDSNYPVVIAQDIDMKQVYTCKKLYPDSFTGNLTHDDFYAKNVTWADSQSVTDNVNEGVYSLVWDNFPI